MRAVSNARRGSRIAHRIVRSHPARPVDPTAVTLRDTVGEPNLTADVRGIAVAAERQRIAGALHDDVSSALFAIAANLQRAEALADDDVDELRRTLSRVGEQVLSASDRLREILRSATPVEPADGVPTAAHRDLDDLTERSGIAAHLMVRGQARTLPNTVERVALSCLRQALFNVERHAGAATVVVTLSYTPDELVLVVQDDGRGLPAGFEPRVVPEAGQHWGFASMARQVEQRGGELDLTGAEDGGTRLRVRLPA